MADKQEIDFAGARVSSSKIPDLKYIPYHSLVRTAARFELGIERKGEKAWNALSQNQQVLTDKAFVIERASHAAHHAMRLIAILTGAIPDDGDDHAAAVAWSGHFLCEATRAMAEAKPPENCSACGGSGWYVHNDNGDVSTSQCPACKGLWRSFKMRSRSAPLARTAHKSETRQPGAGKDSRLHDSLRNIREGLERVDRLQNRKVLFWRALDLARELLKHPGADVMLPDSEDRDDYDYLDRIRYNPELDRFHLKTSARRPK